MAIKSNGKEALKVGDCTVENLSNLWKARDDECGWDAGND